MTPKIQAYTTSFDIDHDYADCCVPGFQTGSVLETEFFVSLVNSVQKVINLITMIISSRQHPPTILNPTTEPKQEISGLS